PPCCPSWPSGAAAGSSGRGGRRARQGEQTLAGSWGAGWGKERRRPGRSTRAPISRRDSRSLLLERDGERWRERACPRRVASSPGWCRAPGEGTIQEEASPSRSKASDEEWKRFDPSAGRMELRVTADDDQYLELPEPRVRQQVSPEVMTRIVDLEGFLRQCRFAPDAGESRLLLEVFDNFAPWNAGRYEITWAP